MSETRPCTASNNPVIYASLPPSTAEKKSSCCLWVIVKNIFASIGNCFKKIFCFSSTRNDVNPLAKRAEEVKTSERGNVSRTGEEDESPEETLREHERLVKEFNPVNKQRIQPSKIPQPTPSALPTSSAKAQTKETNPTNSRPASQEETTLSPILQNLQQLLDKENYEAALKYAASDFSLDNSLYISNFFIQHGLYDFASRALQPIAIHSKNNAIRHCCINSCG